MIRKIIKSWSLKDFLYLLSAVIPVWLFVFVMPSIAVGFSAKKIIISSIIGFIIALVIIMIVDYKTNSEK